MGRKRNLFPTKVVAFRIPVSDHDAAITSKVPLPTIFRKGLETCLIIGRGRPDVIYQLAQIDIERAEYFEHEATKYRMRAQRLLDRAKERENPDGGNGV